MEPGPQVNISDYNYSTTSCGCSSETGRNSFKRIVATQGKRIDKLGNCKYIPMRQNSLLDELFKTKALYEQLRAQYVSSTDCTSTKRDLASGQSLETGQINNKVLFNSVEKVVLPENTNFDKCCDYGTHEISNTMFKSNPQKCEPIKADGYSPLNCRPISKDGQKLTPTNVKSYSCTCVSDATEHYYQEALKRYILEEVQKKQSFHKLHPNHIKLKYVQRPYITEQEPSANKINTKNDNVRTANSFPVKLDSNILKKRLEHWRHQSLLNKIRQAENQKYINRHVIPTGVVLKNKSAIKSAVPRRKTNYHTLTCPHIALSVNNADRNIHTNKAASIPKEDNERSEKSFCSSSYESVDSKSENNNVVKNLEPSDSIISTNIVRGYNLRKNKSTSNFSTDRKSSITPHSNSESMILGTPKQKIGFDQNNKKKRYTKKYIILTNNGHLRKRYRSKLKCLKDLLSENSSYDCLDTESMPSQSQDSYETNLPGMKKKTLQSLHKESGRKINGDLLKIKKEYLSNNSSRRIAKSNSATSRRTIVNSRKIQVDPAEQKYYILKSLRSKIHPTSWQQEKNYKKPFILQLGTRMKKLNQANDSDKDSNLYLTKRDKFNNKILQASASSKSKHTSTSTEHSIRKSLCNSICKVAPKILDTKSIKPNTRSKGTTMTSLKYITVNTSNETISNGNGNKVFGRYQNFKRTRERNDTRIFSHKPSLLPDANILECSLTDYNDALKIANQKIYRQKRKKLKSHHRSKIFTKGAYSHDMNALKPCDKSYTEAITLKAKYSQDGDPRPRKFTLIQNETGLLAYPNKGIRGSKTSLTRTVQYGLQPEGHVKLIKMKEYFKKQKKLSKLNFTSKNPFDSDQKLIGKCIKMVNNIDSKTKIDQLIKKISKPFKIIKPSKLYRVYRTTVAEIK